MLSLNQRGSNPSKGRIYKLTKRYYLQNLLLAVIIFISAYLSFQFAVTERNVSLFWVPMGISLASFLFLGTKVWLGVSVGAFLATLSTGAPWQFAIGAAIANTVEPWLATILMTQWQTRQELDTVGDTLKFLLIGVILAPLLGAFIGSSSFCLTHQCSNERFINTLAQWGVGDAMGALIITPLLLSWLKPSLPIFNTEKKLPTALGFVLLILTNLFVFGIIPSSYFNSEIYSLEYLCFPFLMWAGYKLTQRGATTAIFITVVISIVGTMQGNSPFAEDRVENSLFLLWSFFAVVSIPTLLLSGARTERATVENRLTELAYYDSLTKLPNRCVFYKEVDDFINTCKIKEQNSFCAVLFVDLNRFKEINNSLGHPLGNQVLYQVAQRLKVNVPKEYLVARLGGEEFGIFLPNIRESREAIILAETILNTFRSSFQVNDVECFISLTIGINLGNYNYEKSENIVRDADIAMCNAKQNKKSYCIFNPEMLAKRQSRLTIDQKVRKAITKEELSLFYQPIVDLSSGQITGFETLIRWYNQEQGWISPARFIPIAEETGFIIEIGEWVLKQAFYQLKQWERHTTFDGNNFTLSVNVSPRQLKEQKFVKQVKKLVRNYNIDPKLINLEITETAILEFHLNKVVSELKEIGVGLYLDDFGMGESSLSRLYQLPLDVMKIDRSFIQGIPNNKRKSAIAHTIINLATSMELGVIAEGIETEAQRQQLLDWGCEKGQGFFFYQPLSAEKATEIISSKFDTTE